MYEITKDVSFRVRYVSGFPEEIHGTTMMIKEGRFDILISDSISDQDKKVTLIHELLHVINDDFSKKDVREIEYHCEKETESLLKLI